MKSFSLALCAIMVPEWGIAQNLDFPGLGDTYDVQQSQGLGPITVVGDSPETPNADTIARQTVLDAANDPAADQSTSGIQFGGSLTFGYNSHSGEYTGGSISATKENIGGTIFTGTVSYIDGF